MGCGCEKGEVSPSGSCVVDIVQEIVDAQNDVVENCCTTSCEQSINDLLGETEPGNGLDTVPIILYCKDGCKPFQGFGALPDNETPSGLDCLVSSFIFRAKKVLADDCAVLELVACPGEDCGFKSPCEQNTTDLEATGICITVNLRCFCHITCLPAISLFNN